MRRQFELGDESEEELADALRQLEEAARGGRGRKRKPPGAEEGPGEQSAEGAAADRKAREDVQEAVAEILEERAAAARRPRRRARLGPTARWTLLGVVVVGLAAAGLMALRPRPLPPAATSAQEAVDGFWKALIAGDYEGATVYCPMLIARYGSRKQAALVLRQYFGDNPPVTVHAVGEAEQLPDSDDLRVSCLLYTSDAADE